MHVASTFVLLCTQKAVIFLQTIASQKNPAARLPEVRPICTFHMKKLEEYLENVQWIFLRTEKFFHERYSKVKMIIDTCIKRKISLSLTFLIHCSSPYAQVFYRFFFVVLLRKGEQRLLEKTRNTTDFHANSNPLEDISNPPSRHAMTSRYCVAYFTKVEKFWTGNCTREIGCFYK